MNILTVSTERSLDGLYEVTIYKSTEKPRKLYVFNPGLLWVEGSEVWAWAKRHMVGEAVAEPSTDVI